MPYNIPGGAFDVTVTMVYITIKRVTIALWTLKCPKVAIFKAGLSVPTTAILRTGTAICWIPGCFLHTQRLVKILQLTS